jgi:hypothetical protein
MLNLNKEELDRLIAIKTEEKEIYLKVFGYNANSTGFWIPVNASDIDKIAEMYGVVPLSEDKENNRIEYFLILGGVVRLYDLIDKELDKTDDK